MIAAVSLDGFVASSKALYSYDETERMGSIHVPGLFIVGSDDGILLELVKTFPEKMVPGMATFKEIQRAGHFPMLEKPDTFVVTLTSFFANATNYTDKSNVYRSSAVML
ncbi:hypothetical protein V1523DRAFT_420780 [Lipomyces doorenjongii]